VSIFNHPEKVLSIIPRLRESSVNIASPLPAG
jgi:hypothetical protein